MDNKDLERTKNIANNIKRLIKENGMTQKELSDKIGIAQSTMSDYMNYRSNPSHGVIQKIADYFKVPKSDIDESYKPDNIIEIYRIEQVPLISEVAGGKPIFSEDNFDKKIPFSSEFLPSGDSFFVQCVGDSMEPTIEDGDLVLIRHQKDVENNEIACVVFQDVDSMATLKRVRYINGTMLLEPDNKDHDPYLVKEDDNVRILGKAIMRINKF